MRTRAEKFGGGTPVAPAPPDVVLLNNTGLTINHGVTQVERINKQANA